MRQEKRKTKKKLKEKISFNNWPFEKWKRKPTRNASDVY